MEDLLQEFTYENIYVRHAIDYKPDDSYFNMHIHDRCEMFCFISGDAECLVEGSKYPLERGSLLIMRPAESHRAKILSGRQYERYTVNFPLSAADVIDPERVLMAPFLDRPLGVGNLYLPSEFDGNSIKYYFKQICSCTDKYTADLEIRLCLLSILDSVRKAYLKRDTPEYVPVTTLSGRILAYINEHIFDELSITMLAKHFFISQSQFNRIFKSSTGTSPWEYITLKRLTAAKEKICGGIPVTKACTECGFGDYSAFYRAYVKYFGCSPKQDNK
ncbi:MAG: AraC family transcriptional regulator [Oscillospiraceae bacterium]|nr:AraC family transcriptional regulator [Oscillospiraceae bacterium]